MKELSQGQPMQKQLKQKRKIFINNVINQQENDQLLNAQKVLINQQEYSRNRENKQKQKSSIKTGLIWGLSLVLLILLGILLGRYFKLKSTSTGNVNNVFNQPIKKSYFNESITQLIQNTQKLSSLSFQNIQKLIKMNESQSQEIHKLLDITQNFNVQTQKVQLEIYQNYFTILQENQIQKTIQSDNNVQLKFDPFLSQQNIQSYELSNKQNQTVKQTQKTVQQQRLYYEDKHQIWKYLQDQSSLCVLVYETLINLKQKFNSHVLFRTLNSLMQQEYEQLKIVFVQTQTSDNTKKYQFIKDYLLKFKIQQQKIVISKLNKHNGLNPSKEQNLLFKVSKLIKDNCIDAQIIIIMNEGDQLLGRQVLNLVNSMFKNKQKQGSNAKVLLANSLVLQVEKNKQAQTKQIELIYRTELPPQLKINDIKTNNNYFIAFASSLTYHQLNNAIKIYDKVFNNKHSLQQQLSQKTLVNQFILNSYLDPRTTAAHQYCNSGEIMLIIDGDDFLIGKQVFRFLNSQYQSKNLLAIYTNYVRLHQSVYMKVGTSTAYSQDVIKDKRMRKSKIFRASHLRSFYVQLFKKIKVQDLKDQKGQFFSAANDFAIMMPILQMCEDKFKYIPQLLYVYDSATGLNNFQTKKQIQQRNFEITRKRQPYLSLTRQELKKFLTKQNFQRIITAKNQM